jgi:outer membrane biosynthesis protein TonB
VRTGTSSWRTSSTSDLLTMLRQLTRPGLLIAGLLLLPSVGSAQWIRLADSTVLSVSAPSPWVVGAFPPEWRDSVTAVWSRAFTGTEHRPARPIAPGTRATVALQILRDGTLRRARIVAPTGDVRLDSALIATSWEVMRISGYPKFPVGVEGAGTELQLEVAAPVQPSNGRRTVGASSRGARSDVDLPALTPACDAALLTPNGGDRMTVRAILDSVSGDAARAQWAARSLTAMQPEFHPPAVLAPSYRPKLFFQSAVDAIRMELPGLLRLVVDSTGRLVGAEMVISTEYLALDSALIAMARSADSAGAIPPPPPGAATTTVEVRFAADRGETHRGIPLGRVQFATWELETLPVYRRSGPINYPSTLKAQGIGGRVMFEFVVGVDGRVIPGSLRLIRSPHPELTKAAAAQLLGTVYQPGTARGCQVPVVVTQAINFNPN